MPCPTRHVKLGLQLVATDAVASNGFMRIVIHSLYFYPDKTGTAKYSGEMAQWLSARGHQVSVITGFPHYPEWRLSPDYERVGFITEQWGEVTVHRVPHYIPKSGRVRAKHRLWLDFTFAITTFLKMGRLALSRRPPELVIAVCPPMLSGMSAILCRVLRGTRWIYHIQDYQVDAAINLNIARFGLIGRMLYAVERVLLRSAQRVSSITPAMCRRAVDKGVAAEKVVLFPNWSDIARFRGIARDNAFRRSLPIDDGTVLALYSGSIGAKQGIDLLVEVARRLADSPQIKLMVVSAGPEFEHLKALAAAAGVSNLWFGDLQPPEKLGELLASADIHLIVQKAAAADLVMPSKLTNILGIGRPSIATAEPGTALADVLVGDDVGVVVPPEDAEALAQALRTLASDPERRARLGANALAYAEKNLDKDAILNRFEDEIRAVCAA